MLVFCQFYLLTRSPPFLQKALKFAEFISGGEWTWALPCSPFTFLLSGSLPVQHSVRIERKTLTNRLCQNFFLLQVLRVEPAKCRVKEVDWRAWEGTSCALGLLCGFLTHAQPMSVRSKEKALVPCRPLFAFPAPAPTKSYFLPDFLLPAIFCSPYSPAESCCRRCSERQLPSCLPWPHSWAVPKCSELSPTPLGLSATHLRPKALFFYF